MKCDYLLVLFLGLLIGACSVGKENSNKDISTIQLNHVEIPVNIDSITLGKSKLIHKFLIVELNDSIEGEILKIFTSTKKDSSFNSLIDYLRLNTLNNEPLFFNMYTQWDRSKQRKKNKNPRMDCIGELCTKTKNYEFSYENFKAFAHVMYKEKTGREEFQITLRLQYLVQSMIWEGLENHSEGVIRFMKEVMTPALGKRDDVIRLNSARRTLGIKLQ